MKKCSLLFSSVMIFAQNCTDQVVVMVESIVEKLRKVGQLRVFNAAGQLIHQQQLQPLVEHQIIARNWQPGIYFYRVETPSATTTGKLIRK